VSQVAGDLVGGNVKQKLKNTLEEFIMKNFNQVEDQMLNEMAVEFVAGNEVAGMKFVETVEPKLRNFARKQYSELEKEDLTQEFMVEAIKACYEYADRYADSGKNIMGLVYTKCRQRLIDLGRGDGAEKRSRKMRVGTDEYGEAIYENREMSLQSKVGEDGESTMIDKVAFDQKSVEDQVVDSLNETTLEKVVKDFVASTKGRNGQIVPLVYKANKDDWSTEQLNDSIAKVLKAEKGTEPNNEAIRQAKSRAVKALRNAIIDGKIAVAMQLEWEI
jgi:DNA-directed RNA polymerase specialized sigma24 family protein